MKNKKIIMLGSVIVTILVLFVTVGYSAFNAVVDVKDLSMHIRPDKDIRITNVTLGENSGVNGGLSYNEDWTKQTVFGDISLPNSNSSVKYTVEVKNLGFVDMTINSITLPTSLQSKLNVTISNYTLGDTIAHGTQTMEITLSYKSGQYVSSSTLFNNIVLTFDFQEVKIETTYMYKPKGSTVGRTGTIAKSKVESISFAKTNEVPSDVLGSFDMSQSNNKSIMAWYYDNDSNSKYELVIGSNNGVVYAPENSTALFFNYSSVTTFDSTNFSTEYVTNMGSMFNNCTGLKTLNLSNFDTSNVTNMNSMFYGCSGLTTLNVSNFNTSKVTNMGSMFNNCTGLKTLNLSNFDTSNVTNMNSMFYDCWGLTTLDVSNFNTSKVTDMSSMFGWCDELKSLNLSNFDTSNVTNMNSMFYGCSGLTSLNISNFDTSNVTNMNSMFYDCSGLTTLNLSNFVTSSVKDMTSMFYGCSGLTSLNISSFDTSNTLNLALMFMYCKSLKNLNLSSFDTTNVEDTSGMFAFTSSLVRIDINNDRVFKLTAGDEFDTDDFDELGYDKSLVALGKGYIAVPASMKAAYQADEFWGVYSSKIITIKT